MNNLPLCTAKASGKIILSGEHSVLYGQPALAMAIERFATTTITSYPEKKILFDLNKLNYRESWELSQLQLLQQQIQNRYTDFLAGCCDINDVLIHPWDLVLYAFAYFIEKFALTKLPGIMIKVESNILVGYGMGSSAAVIVGLLLVLSEFFSVSFTDVECVSLGREIEKMQHGQSSGLDLYLALHGGCVLWQNGVIEERPLPTLPIFLVDTGKPENSTGACVMQAAAHLRDSLLLNDFAVVTKALDEALLAQNLANAQDAVRENQRLLERIGTVPLKVQAFVKEIEGRGLAAKICGAGAVSGDKGGVAMVLGEKDNIIDLIQKYKFKIIVNYE